MFASTSTGRGRPRIENTTIEASLAAAEEAAKRIENKRKQAANKAQKLWRNALVIQWVKVHRCSNVALRLYNRHVRLTTVMKRSIHLHLAPHGVPMSRVRLRACLLRLYPFVLAWPRVYGGYIPVCSLALIFGRLYPDTIDRIGRPAPHHPHARDGQVPEEDNHSEDRQAHAPDGQMLAQTVVRTH